MYRLIVFLVLTLGVTCGMSLNNFSNKKNAPFSREQIAKLYNQLLRQEKEVYFYNKLCAILGEEGCANVGIGEDHFGNDNTDSFSNSGERCIGENCIGGIKSKPQIGKYWPTEILSANKRCANFGDEGCSNGGVPGAGGDSDWINGGGSPGK